MKTETQRLRAYRREADGRYVVEMNRAKTSMTTEEFRDFVTRVLSQDLGTPGTSHVLIGVFLTVGTEMVWFGRDEFRRIQDLFNTFQGV